MLRKLLLKFRNYSKIFKFFGIIFTVSVILAFPFRFYQTVGRFSDTNNRIEEKKIDTKDNSSFVDMPSSLFTEITGIQLIPMQRKLCLENNNQITIDGEIVSNELLLDRKEGGALGFKIFYGDSSITQEFYATPGKKDCKDLDSTYEYATTTNTVNIRAVLPAFSPYMEGDKMKIRIAKTSGINMEKSKIYTVVKFNPRVYIYNTVLIFFGVLFISNNIIQIVDYFKRNKE